MWPSNRQLPPCTNPQTIPCPPLLPPRQRVKMANLQWSAPLKLEIFPTRREKSRFFQCPPDMNQPQTSVQFRARRRPAIAPVSHCRPLKHGTQSGGGWLRRRHAKRTYTRDDASNQPSATLLRGFIFRRIIFSLPSYACGSALRGTRVRTRGPLAAR